MPRENVDLVRRGFEYTQKTGEFLPEGVHPDFRLGYDDVSRRDSWSEPSSAHTKALLEGALSRISSGYGGRRPAPCRLELRFESIALHGKGARSTTGRVGASLYSCRPGWSPGEWNDRRPDPSVATGTEADAYDSG